MSRLIQCLQKVTNKVEITDPKTGKIKKHDVFDHETKRGMIAVAQRKLASDDSLSIQDAEMEAVRELRAKVETDIEHVEAAVMAEAAPKAQLATARRPVDRDAKTAEAFARMHAHPEQAMLLAQRIQKEYQRVRAQTLQEYAYSPPESEKEQAQRRKTRAFAELDALVQALPPEIRGDIVGNTMSLAELRASDVAIGDFMVKKIESIDRALEKYFRQIYVERIETLLKKAKAKRAPSGVVKSTIGADAQDVVENVTKYSQWTGDKVAQEYQAIENQIAAGGLDPEEESKLLMKQHEIATFGAINTMSAGQLEVAHADLQNTIRQGKAAWGAKEEARLKDQKLKSVEIVATLPAATAPGVAEANRHEFRNRLSNFARNHASFINVLSWIFPKAKFIADWQSRAIKQDAADLDYVRQTQDRFVQAIGAALGGTKSVIKIGSALGKMDVQNIPVPGGKASQREAMQYLFAWGQPKVKERMLLQGWTDAHIKVLKDATNDPVSQAMRAFFRQEYDAIYKLADAVYVRLYGMHLPRIEGEYAPMRYHGQGSAIEMTPTGANVSSGVTPSAIKARVSHNALLRQVDALQVFNEHLVQMSHWIHLAEFIRETRGVLNNAGAKLALEQSIGAIGVTDLNRQLDAITRGGVARSGDVAGFSGILQRITKGVAVGAMAFNLHSAAVQGDSGLRWMAAIPMKRWARVLLLNKWIPHVLSTAWNSPTVQRRVMGGMDPAVRFAMERDNMTPSLLLKLVDWGFAPINYFDGLATSISSAIVYADAIAQQGMTEEQALQKMDEAVARFSQPVAITSKAQAAVSSGTALKMLLMFMADPMLKTSIVADAYQDMKQGRWEPAIRKIVAVEAWALVAQLILNTWAHVAAPDEDDEDEWLFKHWLRTVLLAPFQGIFVVGNITESVLKFFFDEKVFPKGTAVGRLTEDVTKAFRHWEDLLSMDPSDPKFWKEVDNIIKPVVEVAGGPTAAGYGLIHHGAEYTEAIKEKLEE